MWAALALSFTFGKWALQYAPPMFLIGFRMLCAGNALLVVWFFRKKSKIEQKGASETTSPWNYAPQDGFVWRDAFGFLKVALFHVYLAFVPEFWALQHLDSLKVTLMYSVTPFLSAFFSYALFSEKLSKIKWLALGLGFLGVIPPLLTGDGLGQHKFGSFGFISIPELVLLFAIVSAAYAWFEVKALLQRGYSIFLINGFAMIVGGALSLSHHFLLNPTSSLFPVKAAFPFLGLIAALILLSNLIFYNLYGFLLKRYSYTFLSFTGFLCPIFGTIFGMTFFGESFHWLYLVGFALTFTGLRLFYGAEG